MSSMAKIYEAPKPQYSALEWLKFIAIRIVFPPVLLWDLAKLGANKLFGEMVGSWVLRAQSKSFDGLAIRDETVRDYNIAYLTCEKHKVITHDGVRLDTLEIKHQLQKDTDPKYKKYIINLVGNAECYENYIHVMKQDAIDLDANVVGFNFRGVGQSSGKAKSRDDLVVDGIA